MAESGQNTTGTERASRTREQTLPVGYRLHEYVISKVIGSGGFGVTYLGRDTNLDKAVAIKEYFPFNLASRYDDHWVSPNTSVPQDQNEYEWGRSRFIDEARALAKFEHPNLIRVVRYLEANGTAYIVMDFAEGRPLSTLVNEEGLLSESRLKAILLPLLDGLALVHTANMLHRDVKPENIIIRRDGSPILIDFGAARQAIGSRSRPISTILTPGYAPYEQYFSSGNQGPWTDIYALGAVAYACLTGDAPHEAVQRALDDQTTPAVEGAKGRGSKRFLEAIDWAIRPREADRPQSAEAWKAALLGGAAASATRADATQRMPSASIPPVAGTTKKSGISSLQLFAGFGILAIAAGGSYLAWDLSSPKGGFVNREPVRPSPTAKDTPAEPKAALPTPESKPPAQRTTPSSPAEPQRRAPAQPERSPDEIAADNATFEKAEFIGTPEAYALYLRLHPDGLHADKAQRRTR